jgi:hypothetical protein
MLSGSEWMSFALVKNNNNNNNNYKIKKIIKKGK